MKLKNSKASFMLQGAGLGRAVQLRQTAVGQAVLLN